eukprot:gene16502-22525_t
MVIIGLFLFLIKSPLISPQDVYASENRSTQPSIYKQIIEEYINVDIYQAKYYLDRNTTNLIDILIRPRNIDNILISNLVVEEKNTVPNSQCWSRCQNCLLHAKEFYVITNESDFEMDRIAVDYFGININEVDLSWSLWSEFFHHEHNDQYKAQYITPNHFKNINSDENDKKDLLPFPSLVIERPIYILPMITFHFGHILIDLIEQVYNNMLLTYGKIRSDALFIIDVANPAERKILQQKLLLNLQLSELDTSGLLLKSLTQLPLFSYDLLDELMTMSQQHGILFSDVHFGLDISQSFFNVGYDNHPCILSISDNFRGHQILSKRYQRFRKYLLKFYENKIFDMFKDVRPVFSNITEKYLQREKSLSYRYFQWSNKFWKQGPLATKSSNITVDLKKFKT